MINEQIRRRLHEIFDEMESASANYGSLAGEARRIMEAAMRDDNDNITRMKSLSSFGGIVGILDELEGHLETLRQIADIKRTHRL